MKKKTEKIKDSPGMYEKETAFIEEIQNTYTQTGLSGIDLNTQFPLILKSYEKLLKQIKKITKVGDANQRKLLQAYNQIDEQKLKLDIAYKKLDQLARIDPLTGLSNRRDFLEKVTNEKNRFERDNKSFAFILSDIDNFKSFNDTYGHDCGDFVLQKVAEVFSNTIRKQDALGRWGGEEFILLIPGSDPDTAMKIGEKLRVAVTSNTYHFGDLALNITMTFGVSLYEGKSSIDQCIKAADEALYSGKQQGKNRVILYDDRMENDG